jgi:Amt family ammonium transporter
MPEKMTSAWEGATQLAVSVPGTAWILLGAFLVFLMIPSIGMLEAGLTRRKNSLHGLMKSLSAAAIMIVIFTVVGFGLSFSPHTLGGIIGKPAGFLFGGDINTAWPTVFGADGPTAGVPIFTYVLYQMMFAAVTLALIGAGVPERMKFTAWILFSVFFSLILYPLVAHMVWSFNGFFGNIGTDANIGDAFGVRDFAGGIVVHAQAGFAGLAVTLALGASLRKRASAHRPMRGLAIPDGYAEAAEAERNERYGASLPLAIIGTALLWFGWFGFNGGSSLELNVQGVSAAMVTAVAAATAGAVGILLSKLVDGKYDGIMAISGVLGGLVMITPNAGYVTVGSALILGVMAGVVTMVATKLIERYLYQIDDPVGGFPVHGVNGLLGSIVVPIFAKPELSGFPVPGLLYGGGERAIQWLGAQALAAVAMSALVFVLSFGFVRLLSAFMQVRATYAEEVAGLDAVDHGAGPEPVLVPAGAASNGHGSVTVTPGAPSPSATPLI